MALDNKLGLTSTAELDREEERISKKKAAQLFDRKLFDAFDVGTFAGLAAIHKYPLRTFTTLQVNSEQSILQRAISVLRL